MRRDYDGIKGSIGRSYDEIEGVTSVCEQEFEVKEFDCSSIAEVVNMDIEVASND